MKRTIVMAGFLAFVLLGCQRKPVEPPQSGNTGGGTPTGARIPVAVATSPYRNPAVVNGDVQTVATEFSSRRYAPITVQAGIPVRWTITVAPGNLNGCNGALMIPKLNIRQPLAVGETVVEFTPTETGNLAYSCWMGMIRSVITVVDDLAPGAEAAGAVL